MSTKPHIMIEKQSINGKDVWVEVKQLHVHRPNLHIIPTEYFTARYYFEEPGAADGKVLMDEDGQPKRFESPVAALTDARRRIMEEEGMKRETIHDSR